MDRRHEGLRLATVVVWLVTTCTHNVHSVVHNEIHAGSRSAWVEQGALTLSRQRSGTALKLLWQLVANMLFAGTYQQMKTTEDLEGLKFS